MFAKDKFKPNLFNQDSDSDDEKPGASFGTNKEFAKNFNKLRSKELLKKHKNESDSESTSDADSSDNDTINPKFDAAFFKTMASLKTKDPKIYNGDVRFFGEFDEGAGTSPSVANKDNKALTLVDYERKILLEKGGIYEDDDDDLVAENGDEKRPQSPSYNQEQQTLRDEFKKVIDDGDSDSGEEWGGIFKRRDKSKEEEAAEDAQYTKWLAGENANIGANAETLKPLKDYWSNPKLAKDEAFLRDYILNNGYSNKDAEKVPCYEDIVGDSNRPLEDGTDMSADEEELEKQAEFEHKYNFRFEEPDSEFIKRYPRTIENSVRRTDDRRKEKRLEVKDRKQKEKEQKMRELEMLSNLRKREIEEKIQKLKLVMGDEEIAFNDDDLEGDFDPEAYDRKMQAIFNSEYYQVDEGETKPECPAELEDLQVEDYDVYDPTANADDDQDVVGHCEDDDFNMDADYDPEQQKKAFQSELIENTRDRRKRKRRRSKFVEMLQTKKPVFDPKDHESFGAYLDEYYKLDYEDVIADTPCRFKYSQTVPNNFGLSVEEILLCKNKELNQWASLKKATQIRPEHVERNEVMLFQKKGKNEALKRKILQSLFEEPSEDEEQPSKPATKKTPEISVKTVGNFKKIEEDSTEAPIETAEIKAVKQLPPKPNLQNKKRKLSESSKTEDIPSHVTVSKKAKIKSTKTEKAKSPSKVKINNSKLHNHTNNIIKTPNNRNVQLQSNKNPIVHRKQLSINKSVQSKFIPPKGFDPRKFAAIKQQLVSKPKLLTPLNTTISDERLRAFGINPKKYEKKRKYGGAKTETGEKVNSEKNKKKKPLDQKRQGKKSLIVVAGKGGSAPKKNGGPSAAFEQMKKRMFANKKNE